MNWPNKPDCLSTATFAMATFAITHQHLLLETSGGQISNPYSNVFHFLNTRAD